MWTLRATVALQCAGVAWWFLRVEESPLLAFLWGQPDVGGLGWSENAALTVQHAIGWCAAAAVPIVLVWPLALVLVPLIVLQLALAVAVVRIQGGYQLPWGWLPESLATFFPLVTHAARIAAPVSLMFLEPASSAEETFPRRSALGMACIRTAVVITFIGHAVEALSHYPRFVDYNILVFDRLFGWHLSQSASEGLLTVIAALDFAAALSVAFSRWSPPIYYMAAWGFLTSVARLVVHDWDPGWPEFLIRAPHFGLPLAIAIYWLSARPTASAEIGKEKRNDLSKG